MHLHHVRTFVMVARTGSIARAADRLSLSQPALSAHVRALEEELGFDLFDRTARGMELTRAGQHMVPHAEHLLSVRDTFLAEAESFRGTLHGPLHLGLSGNAETLHIASWLKMLDTQYPDVVVHLETAPSPRIVEDVIARKIDGGFIGALSTDRMGVAFIELKKIKVCAVAPVAWQNKVTHLSALEDLPWVLPLKGTICRQIADRMMDSHGLHRTHVACVANESLVRDLVQNKVGIGFLHEDSLGVAPLRQGVVPVPGFQGEARLGFAYAAENSSPLLAAALRTLRQAWETTQGAFSNAEVPL